MRRLLAALAGTILLVSAGAGVAIAGAPVELAAVGPTSVSGTEATAVFQVGDRTIRQVRYRDRAVLVYTFGVRNSGALPVHVAGLAPLDRDPKLFRYVELTDADGERTFDVGLGETVTVALAIRMENCESLSARAGSFATEIAVDVSRLGFVDERLTLNLPEQLHTGSPREASCPRATATSRPPG